MIRFSCRNALIPGDHGLSTTNTPPRVRQAGGRLALGGAFHAEKPNRLKYDVA